MLGKVLGLAFVGMTVHTGVILIKSVCPSPTSGSACTYTPDRSDPTPWLSLLTIFGVFEIGIGLYGPDPQMM